MSIEELEEILRLDSQMPCSGNTDMDYILCIEGKRVKEEAIINTAML